MIYLKQESEKKSGRICLFVWLTHTPHFLITRYNGLRFNLLHLVAREKELI